MTAMTPAPPATGARSGPETSWRGALAVVLAGLVTSASGDAGRLQSHDDILSAASVAARRAGAAPDVALHVETGRLDPRLQLPACDAPLQTRVAGDAAVHDRVAVEVRCGGTTPWEVRVPAHLRRYRDVTVLRHALGRGVPVMPGDVAMERRETGRSAAVPFTTPTGPVGWITRRALETGTVLTTALLAPARLVRRGDPVTIVVTGSGIRIEATGLALQDGAAGARITVRNAASERIVSATVTGTGVVSVPAITADAGYVDGPRQSVAGN
jgi:flagella basal body P-ring formation protein FlgA